MIKDNRTRPQTKTPDQKTVIVNRRAGPTIIHLPIENGQIPAISLSPGDNTAQSLAQAESAKNPVKKQVEAAAAKMSGRMTGAARIIQTLHPAYLERFEGGAPLIEAK